MIVNAPNMTDIAFEQIKDNYYWGHYGDFRVIIDINNGYINASHLCGLANNRNGSKKDLPSWRRTEVANELINEVSSSLNIFRDDLFKIVTGGQTLEIRGTYVHPKLIPHIASWASVKFAILVSDIINKHMINEAIREKDKLLTEKQDKIDELLIEVRKQSLQIQELLDLNHEMRDQNSELIDTTNDLSQAHDEAKIQMNAIECEVVSITKKLGIATNERVPMQLVKPENKECLRIYARKLVAGAVEDQFKVLRRQNRGIDNGIRALAREGYTELIGQIAPTPNAVDIWNRMKEWLKLETKSIVKGGPARINRVAGNMFAARLGTDSLTRTDIAAKLQSISEVKRVV